MSAMGAGARDPRRQHHHAAARQEPLSFAVPGSVRKLRELIIARRLEAALPKARIFEIYLNVIEWGDGIWGAEAAARPYFGVPASALNARAGGAPGGGHHQSATATTRRARRRVCFGGSRSFSAAWGRSSRPLHAARSSVRRQRRRTDYLPRLTPLSRHPKSLQRKRSPCHRRTAAGSPDPVLDSADPPDRTAAQTAKSSAKPLPTSL